MSRTRTDFTDDQRAELFRLDRATCSFSGRSLWIVDYGMDPSYAIDWADHIVPASRGGLSDIDNGATASWFHNYLRGSAERRLFLFHRGQPTADFWWHQGLLSEVTLGNLRRFANLSPSDWFLNRALWHLWLACVAETEAARGERRSRRKEYYAAASANALSKWRRRREREGTSSLEDRSLVPQAPEFDQATLLSARELSDQRDLLEIVGALLVPFQHTTDVLEAVSTSQSLADLERSGELEAQYRDIPPRIAARILRMIDQFKQAKSPVHPNAA